MALWTAYALVVDNILSFIFIYRLWNCRARLARQQTDDRLREWTRVVGALAVLCLVTWIGLAVLLVDNVCFDDAPATKSLMFRVAFACTPLDFSGALVFIYTVRRLMGQAEERESDGGKVRDGTLEKGAGPGVLRGSVSEYAAHAPSRAQFFEICSAAVNVCWGSEKRLWTLGSYGPRLIEVNWGGCVSGPSDFKNRAVSTDSCKPSRSTYMDVVVGHQRLDDPETHLNQQQVDEGRERVECVEGPHQRVEASKFPVFGLVADLNS
ncbi:hypothetical protein BDK51DRAFT_52934 [Blyttiomyces helicus]|uniref:Uncharacterized protein n=1 Tax=Blyttiomyces helicus TaxID=388810 RepID=A0A4P9W2D8_9FUNG|nr:hypothetical protein BDK51DRAFT_52934 [Blyttiomyces helicus]|eukprot:RKO84246.1 hypothetical protein BDK51DRAFT_52934 [Blyttiomyces helicus]